MVSVDFVLFLLRCEEEREEECEEEWGQRDITFDEIFDNETPQRNVSMKSRRRTAWLEGGNSTTPLLLSPDL